MSQEVEFASQAFPANQRQLALDWLKFTIEKWGLNLTKQKIGSSQELRRSLRGWLAELSPVALVRAAGSRGVQLSMVRNSARATRSRSG